MGRYARTEEGDKRRRSDVTGACAEAVIVSRSGQTNFVLASTMEQCSLAIKLTIMDLLAKSTVLLLENHVPG